MPHDDSPWAPLQGARTLRRARRSLMIVPPGEPSAGRRPQYPVFRGLPALIDKRAGSVDDRGRQGLADRADADPRFLVYAPGDPTRAAAGDVLLASNLFAYSRIVRWFQGLRGNPAFAWPTHAAIFVGDNGEIVEAARLGVIQAQSSNYGGLWRAVLRPAEIDHGWDAAKGDGARACLCN